MHFNLGKIKKDKYVITIVEMQDDILEKENKIKQDKTLMKPPYHLNTVL